VQIIDCHDVAAADLTGTSDVYVTVTWRERFMGATRVKVAEKCHHTRSLIDSIGLSL
jgi:hypothetical protein